MEFKLGNEYHGFQLKREWFVKETNALNRLFIHEKTKAQLLYASTDEDNKVFAVTFKTPPNDDTGVAHILEHSVLCGSRKFPVKEPFIELVKSSLNTFLNAMTFADKTMYPVASTNEEDFQNLIHVYCDAVFYPLIKERPEIFQQEGWHYHLENLSDELTLNGVVYNEMKGAFSSPEEIISRMIQSSLYPDTPYYYEAGGMPECIPSLTYDDFYSFYQQYYHPSNCYCYFYGNGDVLKHLEIINSYIQDFSAVHVQAYIPLQEPYSKRRFHEDFYAIDTEAVDSKDAYYAINWSVGKATDVQLCMGMNILLKILMDGDTAPLRKVLRNSELSKEVSAFYNPSIQQPYISILLKNAEHFQQEKIIFLVEDTLKKLVINGLDKELVQSCIAQYEFDLREADSGSYPKGLIQGIDALDSWLYGDLPGTHLEYEAPLKWIKENSNQGYFEALIQQYFLDNQHSSFITLYGDAKLGTKKEQFLKEQLSKYKNQLSRDELSSLVKNTMLLEAYQKEPDTPEAKATIPAIHISQINRSPYWHELKHLKERQSNIHVYEDDFKGIVYLDLYFPLDHVETSQLPLVTLLTKILGSFPTEKYSDADLERLIIGNLGDLDCYTTSFQQENGERIYYLAISAKCLKDKSDVMLSLLLEIILHTEFYHLTHLNKIIREEQSRMQHKLVSAGHNTVSSRLNSYYNQTGMNREYLTGLDYYEYLKGLNNCTRKQLEMLSEQLQKICQQIISACGAHILLMTDINCGDVLPAVQNFVRKLPEEIIKTTEKQIISFIKNEGLLAASQVQYVAKGYDYKKLGFEYHGGMQVLKKYLTSEYLWNQIRIMGGAYGVFMNWDRSGNCMMISYRDPHLQNTLEIFDMVAEHIRYLSLSNTDIERLIIGTISDIDLPVPAYTRGRRSFAHWLQGDTCEELKRRREQVLTADLKTLHSFSEMIDSCMKQDTYCVLGNSKTLQEHQHFFKTLIVL